MTRYAFAAANSAAQETLLRYRQLANIGVTSSTIYGCTGNQYLYTLGNTYSPVGQFGGVEPIEEETKGEPRTVRMWLSAVGSAHLAEPMREDMFNRPVVLYHGFLSTTSSSTFVSTPELLWRGYINKVDIKFNDQERGNYFEIQAEAAIRRKSEIVNFTKEAHWTTMSQSGDTFFSFIHQVPVVKAMWGNEPTTFNGRPGRGTFVGDLTEWFRRRMGG